MPKANAWQEFKDILLLLFGIVILILLFPLMGAGKFASAVKRLLDHGRRADKVRGDIERAGELAQDAGGSVAAGQERIDSSAERIDESLSINQRSQSLAREGSDILRSVRERAKGMEGDRNPGDGDSGD